MRTISHADDAARGAVWAIGNFDGLHRGHEALFARARSHGLAGVLTFTPHPARILNPAFAPRLILTDDEKKRGVAALGIDLYCALPFDAALAALSADEFTRDILVKNLCAKGAVVGEGFRFGHRATGTVDVLRASLEIVDVVPPVKEGDLVCSSSKIRELILEGKVDAAGKLLGKPYWLEGEVGVGDRRGHTIGIPTANLSTARELLPKLGVYATRARISDGRTFASVTNIGLRPTFNGAGVRIETHLLDFAGDLYGTQLHVDVVAFIRDEMKFPGIDALKAQIKKDIEAAKAVLA